MPFSPNTMIISVDDHLFERPTVFTDRLSIKYQEIAWHVVSDGGQ
jgi:hypothetical protein